MNPVGDVSSFHMDITYAEQAESLYRLLFPSDLSRDEWISALKLSTMWDLAEVRKYRIQMMSQLDLSPAHKVFLGNQYHILAWLKDGYKILVTNGEAMTAEQLKENVNVLGWETMARVLRLRDTAKSLRRHTYYYAHTPVSRNIGAEILREFSEEFNKASEAAN